MIPIGAAAFIGVSVIVLFVGIGLTIYNYQNRNNYHQHRYNDDREQSKVPSNRNLTCPYCGHNVARGDYTLDCGHICHRYCYKSPFTKGGCRFCMNDNEDNDESSHSFKKEIVSHHNQEDNHNTPSTSFREKDNENNDESSHSFKKEIVSHHNQEDNHNTPSTSFREKDNENNDESSHSFKKEIVTHHNQEDNHYTPSTSGESVRRRIIEKWPKGCSYCYTPILGEAAAKKITCGHFAHNECFKILPQFVKCTVCVNEE